MIGKASRVRIVLLYPKVGLVVQQTIQNMSGIANSGVNDLGMKRRLLVRDMRVELYARLLTVFQIYMASKLTATAGFEVLAIR